MQSIRDEYAKALKKKAELASELREAEKTTPDNFHHIWQLRDRVAYWEGKIEAFEFVLREMGHGGQ
jgi:hypothetical protein